MVYRNQEFYNDALKYIELALNINADSIVLKLMRYNLLAYVGDFEHSLQGFDEISKTYFDSWKIIQLHYIYYARSLEAMKKYDDALKVYDEYLEKYPNFPKENIENMKTDVKKLIK